MTARECNFDGLVGPTHNYAGIAPGNLASAQHRGFPANPRAAALEGIAKMQLLYDLGVVQAVFPPQPRPDLAWLRRLGFCGSDAELVAKARRSAPELLWTCYSASSMWVANAATICPSTDAADGRVHLTPANLAGEAHRALELPYTAALLRRAFSDPAHFVHHPPLPAVPGLGDEGAANQTRFCAEYGGPGVQFFVYGDRTPPGGRPRMPSRRRPRQGEAASRAELGEYGGADPTEERAQTPSSYPARQSEAASRAVAGEYGGAEPTDGRAQAPSIYPARQSEAASRAVARLHRLAPGCAVFAEQHPAAIDAGVFHNDVIATGDRNVLLYHEDAFVDGADIVDTLRRAFAVRCRGELEAHCVRRHRISLRDAVASYVFNSQLVQRPEGWGALISPTSCRENLAVHDLLVELAEEGRVARELHYVALEQSMQNGGGPACLRLRVVLDDAERAATHRGLFFRPGLADALRGIVLRCYRDRLLPDDLADPLLIEESRAALDAFTQLLELGSVYDFQRS